MSVLNQLASALGRNDEVPNQLLAQQIAESGDASAVRELVDNLANRDKAIQHDVIKVLYEVGNLKPDLVAPYADAFVKLLLRGDNRMVWGGMTALGAIADRTAAELWKQIDTIMQATEQGSAITQDWGVRVLASVSAQDTDYEQRIVPFLKSFLQTCPPKDLPRHAESALIAFNRANRGEFLPVLESRKSSLKPAQAKRIEQVIRKLNAL
jgi:hypothetical protein